MKKNKKIGLVLNKKVISKLEGNFITGGTGQSVNASCTGMASCGNCTVHCYTTRACQK